jgi:hypothetical protein
MGGYMDAAHVGLALNFVGAVLLGVSSQFGLAAGFGGPIVWKKTYWGWINVVGWSLLAIGFLIQFIT